MRFSSNENRNNYYIEKYGFVPSFATRKNPKKATSDAAIQNAQQSRRNIASKSHHNVRKELNRRSRVSIAKAKNNNAIRRAAIYSNPRSTIYSLLKSRQLNKRPSGGYITRKQRKH